MLTKGAIGLGIRDRKPASDLERFAPENTKAWIDELPMANVGETSRQLYELLSEANRILLQPKLRFELLNQLLDGVAHITRILKKHYIEYPVSLTQKQQKIANFCQAIDVEMAIGYKTVIEDLIADEAFGSDVLTQAVNATLHLFIKIQTRSYQLYHDLPKGMWHEIHLLYQLAEQNQFHKHKVRFAGMDESILSNYQQLMLLATTNPNQIRQQQISKVAEGLRLVTNQFEIKSDPEDEYDFLVNLNSDAPPFHRSLLSGEMKAHYRGFNLGDLVANLQTELQEKEVSERLMKLDDATQKHLLLNWGSLATRTFVRRPADGTLQVAIGLSASHYLIEKELLGEEEIEPEGPLLESLEGSLKDAIVIENNEDYEHHGPTKKSHPGWNEKANAPILKDQQLWDSLYRNKSLHDKQDDTKPYEFINKAQEHKVSQYDFNSATIINISPGGFCLKFEGLLPKQTQTGEIMALVETETDGEINWNIGTIRWIRRKNTSDLELGIQLISPNARPVKCQLLRSHHVDDNLYQRCLILPAIPGIGQPETLLTSPLPFKELAKVRMLSDDSKTVDLKLTHLISSGQSYKQFTFKKIDQANPQEKDSEGDFDSVWDII